MTPSATPSADIVLLNGRILAGEGSPTALAVAGGRVLAVGRDAEIRRLATKHTTILDCAGRAVIPGIVDAHCHLLASAAASLRVDCRPAATGDVDAIVDALRRAAASSDRWVRGYGYDDSPVGLGRHLDRRDLDRVSTARPVRVEHRSGHACVLNSRALAMVGIDRQTPNPPGGVIVRDHDGEPTGLLLEMSGWLRRRAGEPDHRSPGASEDALRDVGQRMLAYGITGATDAGPDNGPDRWRYFEAATGSGAFPLRLTMMAGGDHLEEMREAGLGYGSISSAGRLAIGHAKIMLTASVGRLHPHPDQLARMVAHAHELGFPVAIHAVERDAVVAAALAIKETPLVTSIDGSRPQDRIEHCGECPPDVLDLVAQSGAMVVANPGFLHYDGERYRRTVDADLLPHLYPVGALAARGVPVALGSDAPVVDPNPWAAIAASMSRQSANGVHVGGIGVPTVVAAIAMHLGARRIVSGMPADLAVVEPDPMAVTPAELPTVRSVATIVDGRVAWCDGT